MSKIVIETKLKVLPKTCTKCKYSYLYGDGRWCSVMFDRYGGHKKLKKEYIPDARNYSYVRPQECPLREQGEHREYCPFKDLSKEDKII